VLTLLLVLASASCSSPVRQDARPVSERAAVVAWASDAAALRQQRQFDGAAALLERALRIEPRNAHLWHQLARVHFDQGDFDQAIQFARKSMALSGEPDLRSSNRRLIKAARSRLERSGGPARRH
jgi:tetratricopeptide (TPR) repeat protein